mgnify:FL=1
MPCRPVCRTALRTLLTGPRFRPDFDRDTVFLGGTRQSLGELLERPEVVCLGVYSDRPVRVQHVSQATDIHRVHAIGVQPFEQVTTQCLLCVGTATSPFPVQPPNTLATIPAVIEFRLQPGDFSRRLTESVKQLAALIKSFPAPRSHWCCCISPPSPRHEGGLLLFGRERPHTRVDGTQSRWLSPSRPK